MIGKLKSAVVLSTVVFLVSLSSTASASTYVVNRGDTLWGIASSNSTTVEELKSANGISSNIIQPGQVLSLADTSASQDDTNPTPPQPPQPPEPESSEYGEYLEWSQARNIFSRGTVATVTDVSTGLSFEVKRYGGSNHADTEPRTAKDTAIMKKIYGGSWSWSRKAIIVNVDGRDIAASMNGMPHASQSIYNNNFYGHFCIHFKDSRTHSGNSICSRHQAAVKEAAGIN